MSDQKIFADGVLEANVMNGVVRITLGQAGGDGKPVPCGQILVPLAQLPAVTNGLVNLVRQIEVKMKEAAEKGNTSATAATAQPTIEAQAIPSAFTFQKN